MLADLQCRYHLSINFLHRIFDVVYANLKYMKKLVFLLIVFLTLSNNASPWGFWGHKRINRIGVFTLPEGMFGFFKHHIEYITQNAVNPDKRRYAVAGEAPRHFIDIDHYGTYPFDEMPRKWKDAVAKYSEDTLMAYGIVPWHVERNLNWLTQAMREKDALKILRLAADLGHYVADAHVPLHTTSNYNGQLTNQIGIHGFWESRIPELFGEEYDYFVGKAKYIDDPLMEIWDVVLESHKLVDSVLSLEKNLRDEFPSDQVYSYEQRLSATVRVYSESYSREYDRRMGNMVERRMRESIHSVGNFWYTAWVNAGQPDLDKLLDPKLDEELKREIESEPLQQDTIHTDKHFHGRPHPNTGWE